jgi:hypothetical protein
VIGTLLLAEHDTTSILTIVHVLVAGTLLGVVEWIYTTFDGTLVLNLLLIELIVADLEAEFDIAVDQVYSVFLEASVVVEAYLLVNLVHVPFKTLVGLLLENDCQWDYSLLPLGCLSHFLVGITFLILVIVPVLEANHVSPITFHQNFMS